MKLVNSAMLLRTATLFVLAAVVVAPPPPPPPPPPVVERCNYDNCLRVMTNTPSVASTFCSTWLQPTTVVTATLTVYASSRIAHSILLMLARLALSLAPLQSSLLCLQHLLLFQPTSWTNALEVSLSLLGIS